ncbi:MAG: protein-L-isoaspartate O-methyltransferase [Paucibacter sp.]|nr:protein-L-isoaspartate O-methyltransferase [Roseateles sp.]
MNTEQARFNMIEQQIRPWNVLDPSVLSLLAVVRREDFVPAEHRSLAFMDVEVPLGAGQSMLPPRVEARILQEMQFQRHEKVLEIGTGSGYMAALLGHKVQAVHTLETDPGLAAKATENLRRAGAVNVTVHQQDGAAGLAAEAPFDAIVMSGSVAEVPQALLEQLKVGGRLFAIVGSEPVMVAQIITRTAEHSFVARAIFDTVAQRLVGFAEPKAFSF